MRQTTIDRQTRETEIHVQLNLDGQGQHDLATGVPFLNHMLSHVAVHGSLDLVVSARGDTDVDDHHTVEDVGICLGQAMRAALGDKRGITRYAHQLLPMDEALVLVAMDLSGRGLLVYDVPFPQPTIGLFHVELVHEFLQALATNAGLCLHVKLLYGSNAHHIAEAVFKGVGRCLGEAVRIDPDRANAVPSTKGMLS
jgi:imidazoleglycerol-phosphate dehydratase